MALFRSENVSVTWAPETTWGVRPVGATWRQFGLHETVEAPDPTQGWQPFYGITIPGVGSRNRSDMLRGPWDLRGSIPDIRLCRGLAGPLLALPIGRYVDGAGTVLEGQSSFDDTIRSFTMQIAARDSLGVYSFIREYYGGKVGRATIRAAEGQDVRVSLDEVIWQDMRTNVTGTQKSSTSVVYQAPADFDADRFLFAGGTLSFFGTTLARVKNLTLSIDNQLEAKRYIHRASGDSTTMTQVITDLVEGRRVYNMQVDFDVVDDTTDLALFKYLLNESGPNGGETTGGQVLLDFAIPTSEGSGSLIISAGTTGTVQLPGSVVTGGRISIPAPPAGRMDASYTIDVDSISISVP